MKGLAPHTSKIFESVSMLDCIKPYLLVGGTALSLQIGTRQSEDLDFMKWRKTKNEKPEVDWFRIEKELGTIGKVQHPDAGNDCFSFGVFWTSVKNKEFACYADQWFPVYVRCPF